MNEVRHEILGLHHFVRRFQCRINVTAVTDLHAALARRSPQFIVISTAIMGYVRARVPIDLQLVTALHHRPGIGADHRHAAKGAEFGRLVVGQGGDLHDPLDALDFQGLRGVERFYLAAIDRRSGHHGHLHAGN